MKLLCAVSLVFLLLGDVHADADGFLSFDQIEKMAEEDSACLKKCDADDVDCIVPCRKSCLDSADDDADTHGCNAWLMANFPLHYATYKEASLKSGVDALGDHTSDSDYAEDGIMEPGLLLAEDSFLSFEEIAKMAKEDSACLEKCDADDVDCIVPCRKSCLDSADDDADTHGCNAWLMANFPLHYATYKEASLKSGVDALGDHTSDSDYAEDGIMEPGLLLAEDSFLSFEEIAKMAKEDSACLEKCDADDVDCIVPCRKSCLDSADDDADTHGCNAWLMANFPLHYATYKEASLKSGVDALGDHTSDSDYAEDGIMESAAEESPSSSPQHQHHNWTPIAGAAVGTGLVLVAAALLITKRTQATLAPADLTPATSV